MVEVGLSLSTKKEEKESLEAPLAELGVHVFVDRHFDKRVEENLKIAGGMWDDETLEGLEVSPAKKAILKRVNRMRGYLEENVPHGRAVEKPKFSAAVVAMNELFLMSEDLAFSDTPDGDAVLLANDFLSRANDIAWHTFDSKNTVVNKTFTVQQQGPQMKPGQIEVVSPNAVNKPDGT